MVQRGSSIVSVQWLVNSVLRRCAPLTLVCSLLAAPLLAQTLPQGGKVIAGGATIGHASGKGLNVQQSTNRAVIDWNSFSIGSGETVTFLLPSATSATLNRVTGSMTSVIAGELHSNGELYLINPNGIEITPTGVINTRSFAASALAISDTDFLSGKNLFTGNGDGNKMILTPTYHVFEMYKVHQDATYLPVELASPPYAFGDVSIPAISATASRDTTGKVHLSLVNVDPHRRAQLVVHIPGLSATRVDGRVLTATAMDAHNSFDQPDAVKPAPFTGAKLERGELKLTLPTQSVVVLGLR
jgi:filamentous hemagglutinin family protein